MGLVQDLVIQYRANVTNAVRGIQDLNRNINRVNRDVDRSVGAITAKMNGMGKAMTVGITAPLVLLGKSAVQAAMAATESENLFAVSMGKMAVQARGWSQELSKSLGLNGYEIRKNVATFNVMLDSMEMGTKRSYEMAKGLTQLAYDMASLYNLDTEDAFQKLQSGISGEVEPLKRLGIIVNDTRVKTYALTQGIAKQGEELTDQQKILARYGLIMESTKKAQGDLKRTGDSTTNSLRSMKSKLSELSIEFGNILLPVMDKAVKKAKDYTIVLSKLSLEHKELGIKAALVFAASGPILVGMASVVNAVATLRAAYIRLGTTAAATWLKMAGPVGLAIGITAYAQSIAPGPPKLPPGQKELQNQAVDVIKSRNNKKSIESQRMDALVKLQDMPMGPAKIKAFAAVNTKYDSMLAAENKKKKSEKPATFAELMKMGELGSLAKGPLKPANPFKLSGRSVVPKGSYATVDTKTPAESEQERDDRLSQFGMSWISSMVMMDKMTKDEELAAYTRIQKKYPGASLATRASVYAQKKSIQEAMASAKNGGMSFEDMEFARLDKEHAEIDRNNKRNAYRQKYADEMTKARDEVAKTTLERIQLYRREAEEKRKSVYEMMEAERQMQRDKIQWINPSDIWRNLMVDSVRRQYGPNRNTYQPANLNGPVSGAEVARVQIEQLSEQEQMNAWLSQIVQKMNTPSRVSEMLPNAY